MVHFQDMFRTHLGQYYEMVKNMKFLELSKMKQFWSCPECKTSEIIKNTNILE